MIAIHEPFKAELLGKSPIEQCKAEMKTVDLEPDEFEVIELGPPLPPIDPFAELSKKLEELGSSFEKFGKALRRIFPFDLMPIVKPEAEPRPRHHMQFIEQHIRKARKFRK